MKFYRIFRVFRVMSATTEWYEKAMQDGVITPNEAAALVTKIGNILDLKVTLEPLPPA